MTQYTALYFEYGATPKLKLGIDAGRSVSGGGKLVLFAGWPIFTTDDGHALSIDIGVGQIEGAQVLRPAISYGKGFQRRGLNLWAAADAAAEVKVATREADYKLDLTFGLAWPSGLKAFAQLQTGQPSEFDAFARVAGNVVVPNRFGFATEFGVEYGVFNDDLIQFKVGVWKDF
ncbi:hypothetical protein [Pseudaestuariivita sp.]|uniref:hypothetical protein n=1 Tax=Pseudaestuariivita sp. TaxID=2211669 RepID=UPI004058839B